ncbi:hypothetical protein CH333_03225 [candidate division WOR-3 bacterium JGI_Cruoil_03_44_89]|uniref:Cadherin-like beta-sandwich-like domain-containing protein n=1 Tax=candidate division WOR-3 bacterium JGI_Cruoil_03_44_89 TaxID=1973748 RepID=A0A235BYA2_UNCW3|nr:MAG: hypothetical protein CH333_03225 [candidate division WOR-3 bacterium JGI_Cruoil_03_44_89]
MARNYLCLVLMLVAASCGLFDSGSDFQSNANLKALSIPNAQFSPSFSPNITVYSVTFDGYPRSFSLTATAENNSATIKVNGTVVESGQQITIQTSPPDFVVNIVVTSANGKNTKTYVLNIVDD